ncbi:MAG: PEGA domain-containing protein, partial [Polyangiaceae bacterium]
PAPTPDSDSGDKSAASSDKGGMGFLNINSLPVSRILLDGQPMGETPKTGVQVSPGTHTVTFVNPDLPKKSVSVTVKAGETKTASAKLRD